MNSKLEKLLKEDLVSVIANMHDTIQEWDNGWGIPEEDSKILNEIGSLCVAKCVKTHFNLPNLKTEEDEIN